MRTITWSETVILAEIALVLALVVYVYVPLPGFARWKKLKVAHGHVAFFGFHWGWVFIGKVRFLPSVRHNATVASLSEMRREVFRLCDSIETMHYGGAHMNSMHENALRCRALLTRLDAQEADRE